VGIDKSDNLSYHSIEANISFGNLPQNRFSAKIPLYVGFLYFCYIIKTVKTAIVTNRFNSILHQFIDKISKHSGVYYYVAVANILDGVTSFLQFIK